MKAATFAAAWFLALAGAQAATSGKSASARAAVSAAGDVTLAVRGYTNVNRVRVLVFTGVVADPGPGQDVEIVGQDCGVPGNRLIAATKTTAGGAFHVENPSDAPGSRPSPWSSGITFRARWNGRLSGPIQYRLPAQLFSVRVRSRTWRVSFNPYDNRARMDGKLVVLQRFADGRWVRLQAARLKLRPSLRLGAFNHEVTFTVAARGLRLRALLPAQSAAPCWVAGTSEPWRS